eukprot:COSAG04_NODE_2089_length_4822_cov_39.655939_8_plen_74_part_01
MESHGQFAPTRGRFWRLKIDQVWPRFVAWAEAKVGAEGGGKVGCFVWWNGVSCDLECMHKIVDIEHYEELRWPA